MASSYFAIFDGDDNPITDGVQEYEVERMAQRIANDRGETVYYSRHPEIDPETEDFEEVETTAVHPVHRAGKIPAEWLEAARQNEVEDDGVAEWFARAGNFREVEIDDDGSVHAGGRWLSQSEIDELCRRIDAGV